MEIITTHINADFDAMASMVAARILHPNAVPVFPGSQERNLRNFFVESMVYDLGLAKLKSIDLADITRLILVDTRQRSRIGRFAEILEREDLSIYIYDHHPPSPDDVHGHYEVIREVGATTTILTGLIQNRGMHVSPKEATIMALGIYEDTGSFTFSSTTAQDFHAAGFLLDRGADLSIVQDMMSYELTSEQVALLNEMIQSAERIAINGIELLITRVSSNSYVGDFAVLVHKLMEMENAPAVFALAQMEERVYLVGRSRIPEVNVAEILVPLGGGGHPTAGSATVKGQTSMQLEQRLLRMLKSKVNPSRSARDMMSYPVIGIRPDQTLGSAADTLIRYNINVLPVLDDGRMLGHISRQVVEKALFHGLKELPLSEYMNTDFTVVAPDAGLPEIQERIIEENQRILPVVEDDRLVGVITRTDLLSTLVQSPFLSPYSYDSGKERRFVRKKNVAGLMKERLNRQIIDLLKSFGRVADDLKTGVYAVGGFVRDLLLRRDNLDIDIVVEGDGIRFAETYAERNPQVRVRVHKKFNTAVIIFEDGFTVDVATARREVYESPASLPIVELSSIKLDLYRRDFTINTLALQLNSRHFGTLIDFFGAQRDIKEKTIRVLHNLSFVEDPTRVFRAIRFEKRFGFRIGKLTIQLIDNARRINVFKGLSGRRLFHEIQLMLNEERPVLGMARMNDLGLLPILHPSIRFDEQMEELFLNVDVVLNWYDLLYLQHKYAKWKVYFLALGDPLSRAEFEEFLKRLEIPKYEMLELIKAKEHVDLMPRRIMVGEKSPMSEIHRALSPATLETLLCVMAKTRMEQLKKAISIYFTRLSQMRLSIGGRDLKELGYPPGPMYGKILDAVFSAKLNGEVDTREEELDFVQSHFPVSRFREPLQPKSRGRHKGRG